MRWRLPMLPTPRAWPRLVILGLVLATLTVFSRGLLCDFVDFDDPSYVTDNPPVKAGLTWAGITWAWTTTHTGYWHPLTWMSLMLDVTLWGRGPLGFHATSLVLHALNVVLVFVLLRRLTGAMGRSAAVALLWAVHPLRVESVVWIAERKDVLCVLPALLSLLAYERYARTPPDAGLPEAAPQRPPASSAGQGQGATPGHDRGRFRGRFRGMWYVATWLLMAASLCAKPMMVTLPCLMLLLDWWPLDRWRIDGRLTVRRSVVLVLEKLPGVALSGAVSMAAIVAQRLSGTMASAQQVPLSARPGNALVANATYLVKMVWPTDLVVLYPLQTYSPGLLAASGLIAGLLLIAMVLLRRRVPGAVMGACWWLGTILPTIGLIQVGVQAYADRYTYFPSIGLLMLAVWPAAALVERFRWLRGVALAALLAGATGLGCRAFDQCGIWQNSLTLWEATLRSQPLNPVARANYGRELAHWGLYRDAEAQLREAIHTHRGIPSAHANLGKVLLMRRQVEGARLYYQEASRLAPRDADIHWALAMLAVQQRDPAAARRHLEAVTGLRPQHVEARVRLGLLLRELGDAAGAERELRRALEAEPRQRAALAALGQSLLERGAWGEAALTLRHLLAISPEDVGARKSLAFVMLNLHQYEDSIAQFRLCLRQDAGDPKVHLYLGLALLKAGHAEPALEAFAATLRLDPKSAAAHYHSGQAWALLGRHEQAQAAVAQAAKLEPQNPLYRNPGDRPDIEAPAPNRP